MFIEVTTTIPASGETEVVDVSGVSVIVGSISSYGSATEKPQFSFETAGNEKQRAFLGATYQYDRGKFTQLIVHGNDDQENDEITFYITPACLEEDIPPVSLLNKEYRIGETAEFTSTDTAQTLDLGQLLDSEGKVPTAIYVSSRTFDINYDFNVDPTNGDSGHILVADSEPLKIIGLSAIQGFTYINKTGGSNGLLVVTPEY